MTVPQLAVLSAATACFVSYGWGLLRFFADPGGGRGTGTVKGATAASVAAHVAAILFFYEQEAYSLAVSLLLYALSLAMFWWAIAANHSRPLTIAFSPDAPLHLVTAGPYAYIRHPLYVSYMLCWIAGALATGQALLVFTVLLMGALYHRAAAEEERKFAQSALHAEYALYAQRTGRYFPKFF
jgi:protein-S-isoprenylcysteine O-methyltransferase Ste14